MRRRTAHFIRLFLGSKHWTALWQAYCAETGERRSPAAGWPAVCAAILIAGAPGILTAAAHNTTRLSWLPTAAIGICTVLAILIRHRLALPGESGGWRRAFRLTHTSAALGCIPAVLVYLLIPNALPDRRGELAQAAFTSAAGPSTPLDAALVAALCIAIAVWAAVTEEFIYRGLLVGVVRRFAGLGTQWQRDILAVFLSAVLFGGAHAAVWGGAAALALAGLGFGFAVGYIANGEKLMPLIAYHFLFDLLSIAAVLLR